MMTYDSVTPISMELQWNLKSIKATNLNNIPKMFSFVLLV